MQLSENEQTLLLKEFPRIELSYETNVHKKVYSSNFVVAIPAGQKCFVWFTIYKNQNVCILLEISEHKRISKIRIVSACFHNELSYGTIIYGTIFHHKYTQCVSIEDIFYYKGHSFSSKPYSEKLTLFYTIFSSEIRQVSYFQGNILFGLPIICTTYNEIYNKIQVLPYKIKHVQYIYNTNKKYNVEYSIANIPIATIATIAPAPIARTAIATTPQNIRKMQPTKNKSIIFKVRPDIQNDIYHLYCKDEKNEDSYYDVAYIPDYKSSVTMNSLFRNIKENINLDALEESDDEEEFENDKPDKFVYLEREYLMVCIKNRKFNKWVPVKVVSNNDHMITKKELCFYNK